MVDEAGSGKANWVIFVRFKYGCDNGSASARQSRIHRISYFGRLKYLVLVSG
jgi:hypothetical protein